MIEFLHLGVGYSSSVKGFQIFRFFFQDLSAVIHSFGRFVEFEIGLGDVESQNIEELLCFRRMLVLYEIDSFLII